MDTQTLIKKLLENFGEDPEREGLKETPCRVQKMYEEILNGYNQEPKDIFKFFNCERYDGTVELKEIPFLVCANITCYRFGEQLIFFTDPMVILLEFLS